MKQFVPMTDEMLYQQNGCIGPLVPFRLELPCHRALRPGLTEDERRMAHKPGEVAATSPEDAALTDELPVRRRA